MKAMVLAAGVGSRLRPLTDATPKALIEVGGETMLERVLRRLAAAGVTAAIVNLFHLPDKIESFLKSRDLGLRIALSRETELLDTGGGLKKAAPFFDDGKPFFVHNVDVDSEIDLKALYRRHLESPALATLSVRARPSSRLLLFDREGRLRGREAGGRAEWAGAPVEDAEKLGFDGIHVVSPELFPRMTETGVFPILRAYLRLAAEGERLQSFRSDPYYWADIGDPKKLESARRRAAAL